MPCYDHVRFLANASYMLIHSFTIFHVLCCRKRQTASQHDVLPLTAGVHPSTLSLLLRHLLRTYETCHLHSPPTAATEEVRKLPEQLLSSTRPKDPPPLPVEDQGGAAKAPQPLAVEDAQARRASAQDLKKSCLLPLSPQHFIPCCAAHMSCALQCICDVCSHVHLAMHNWHMYMHDQQTVKLV